ncbi:MAG: T9SS type A sorting domain-containing protein, partial [Ignavibacteriae bacterium]|nr:T9SS type A sorting domain-containing protein [Ignavibacteriota bacterium]
FNPTTTIKYSIPSEITDRALLKIYDILGREVITLVNEVKKPGTYEVKFDASNLSSGIYFYTLKAGSFYSTKKMMLLK